MDARKIAATSLMCACAAALIGCSSEPGSEASEGEIRDVGQAATAADPTCALLDDAAIRMRMSSGLETALLEACGRMPAPAPARRAAPSSGGGELFSLLSATDVLVNDPATDIGGTTQSETSIAVVGNVICVAYNDSGSGGGPFGRTGHSVSLNGGASFIDGGGFPTGTNPSDGVNRADPSLAFSARDNVFYYAALSQPLGSVATGISLWRSTDSCQSFTFGGFAGGTGPAADKELIAIDNTPTSPFYGRIHLGWTEFSRATDIIVATFSDNGGQTWSAPAPLPGSGVDTQGVYPAVAPNGDVYMTVLNLALSVGGLQDQFMFKSTNGGVSWTKMPNIGGPQLRPEDPAASAACQRQSLTGNIRYLSSTALAISPDGAAPAGYAIHGVYSYDSDGAGADHSNVFYRRSVDGALSWSAEIKLNDDATTTDQFFPALGVSDSGTVVASWYDRRLDPANNLAFDRFAASSTNGLVWSANTRLSDVTSPMAQTLPNFDGAASNCYHGDYDQVVVSGNVGHIVWSDDRRVTESGPNPDVYYDSLVVGCENDTTPPEFTFVPADVTTSVCGSFDFGTATATDACGVTVTNNAPAQFPPGTTIVTWTATDAAGNVTTATQRVTLVLTNNPACCPAGTNVIVGTSNNNTLNGTNGSDCILGLGAQDTINGLGGADFISGGDGNDNLSGGDGNDVVFGGTGQDQLNGNNGNDNLSGGDGDDVCNGGTGADTLSGGQGQDQLFGQDNNDALFGDDGDDTLNGGAGNDNLVGGANNDNCNGATGTNTFAQCEFGAPNSCLDTVQNGTETDTDCGGGCPRCAAGDTCISGNDCQTSLCVAGVCSTPG